MKRMYGVVIPMVTPLTEDDHVVRGFKLHAPRRFIGDGLVAVAGQRVVHHRGAHVLPAENGLAVLRHLHAVVHAAQAVDEVSAVGHVLPRALLHRSRRKHDEALHIRLGRVSCYSRRRVAGGADGHLLDAVLLGKGHRDRRKTILVRTGRIERLVLEI